MQVSVSGRKNPHLHIDQHIPFILGHTLVNSGERVELSDIDYIFGFPGGHSVPLFGGRINDNPNISKEEIYWLYYNNIGLKLPLTSVLYSNEMYEKSKGLLEEFHNENNCILVSTEKLARKIRDDFPKYKIELSAIKDIDNDKKLSQIDRSLFNTICLPICANDNLEFLENIENKDQIRLFWNVECSYNCPKKICYTSISKLNNNDHNETMKCSSWTYNLPRTFYRDEDWDKYYFDIEKFKEMGFSKFKLLTPDDTQRRIELMNK